MAGAAEEAQGRDPPGGRPLLAVRLGGRREALTEHSGPELGPGRLAERVVLGDGQQRCELHPGDSDPHPGERRWGVVPTRPAAAGRDRARQQDEDHPAPESGGHPMSDPKIAATMPMYEALGRGDIEAIVIALADDVEWVSVSETPSPAVPWYGSYRGKDDVPRFFKEIVSSVDITEFTPLSYTANDTDAMVAIRW